MIAIKLVKCPIGNHNRPGRFVPGVPVFVSVSTMMLLLWLACSVNYVSTATIVTVHNSSHETDIGTDHSPPPPHHLNPTQTNVSHLSTAQTVSQMEPMMMDETIDSWRTIVTNDLPDWTPSVGNKVIKMKRLKSSSPSKMPSSSSSLRKGKGKILKKVIKMKKKSQWLKSMSNHKEIGDHQSPLSAQTSSQHQQLSDRGNGKIVCVHVVPKRASVASNETVEQLEQFNLIRKCYPRSMLAHRMALQNVHTDNAEASRRKATGNRYEMDNRSTISPLDSVSIQTDRNETVDPSTAPTPSSLPPYVNVYEYVPNDLKDDRTANNETNPSDQLDQSPSSDIYTVVQKLKQVTSTPLESLMLEKGLLDSESDVDDPLEDTNNATPEQNPQGPTNEFNGVKDLWQVNRRKKQLTSPSSSASDRSRLTIPKLLLPKVNRPAMYSLNGYVPRPSLNRLTIVPNRALRKKTQKRKSSRTRSKMLKRMDNDNNETVDEIEVSESVNRNRHQHHHYSQNNRHKSDDGGGNANSLLSSRKKDKKTVMSSARGVRSWPTLASIPKTSFDCGSSGDHSGTNRPDGVYADHETGCQVWHVCQNGAMHSFLCPNGTIFNVKNGVCDWWYNSRCG